MMLGNRTRTNRQIEAHRQRNTQGFALVEVVIAAFLTLIFTSIAMQTLVLSAAVRISAQENSESNNWIQGDLESVRANATRLDYCEKSTDAGCTGIPAQSYKTNLAQCTATTTSNGYANALQTQIQGTQNLSKASQIGNRPYTLRRETSVKNSAPYNVLQITYKVYRGAATTTAVPTGKQLTSYYSEVIPGASFACR